MEIKIKTLIEIILALIFLSALILALFILSKETSKDLLKNLFNRLIT